MVLLPKIESRTLVKKLREGGLFVANSENLEHLGETVEVGGGSEGMGDAGVVAVVWEDVCFDRLCEHKCLSQLVLADPEPPLPPLPLIEGFERRAQRCSHVIYTSGTSGPPKGVVYY